MLCCSLRFSSAAVHATCSQHGWAGAWSAEQTGRSPAGRDLQRSRPPSPCLPA